MVVTKAIPHRLHNRPAAANLDHGLRTPAAEVVNASGKEKPAMKCTIAGCPGVYEPPDGCPHGQTPG